MNAQRKSPAATATAATTAVEMDAATDTAASAAFEMDATTAAPKHKGRDSPAAIEIAPEKRKCRDSPASVEIDAATATVEIDAATSAVEIDAATAFAEINASTVAVEIDATTAATENRAANARLLATAKKQAVHNAKLYSGFAHPVVETAATKDARLVAFAEKLAAGDRTGLVPEAVKLMADYKKQMDELEVETRRASSRVTGLVRSLYELVFNGN